MVPSLEQPEYMLELRNVAENIVRERCTHSEVHAPTCTEGVESYKVPDGSDGAQHPLAAHPVTDEDSIHVGAAIDLPPGPCTSTATARNLVEELDVVSCPASVPLDTHVDTNKFAEVSQIAQEAVMIATQVDNPGAGV